MISTPIDPQFLVGTLTALAMITVPVLAIVSSLRVPLSTTLNHALFDKGGGASGRVPSPLLLPTALLTYTLRDWRAESQP